MESNNNSGEMTVAHDERYRIITKLESGGMADIYLGIQLGVEEAFERLVVIKKIRARGPQSKKAMGMFLDEARVVASLNHPHIVQIFDLSRVKNSVCITMEYIDGENLDFISKWLKNRDQEFPLSIICRLIIQACEALQYAHTATNADGEQLNIIHRDIDLRNLMLDSNGYLKVIDFGVAKANTQVELTAPTMFKGKLSFLAPETFQEKNIDHRVDIYALGLVFYQLVTGVNPFPFKSDANLGEVINVICTKEVENPSELNSSLPKEIDEIIAIAIEKDRDKRYQKASEFAAALRDFSNDHGGIAGTDEVKEWFNTQFEKRHQHRRKYEQTAMRKARDLAQRALALKNSQQSQEYVVSMPPNALPPVPSNAPPTGSNSYPYQPGPGSSLSSFPAGQPGSFSSVSSIPGSQVSSGAQYYPDSSGNYPGTHPSSLHPSGAMVPPPYTSNYPASASMSAAPPQKSANPYILMIIAFLLFTVGAILVHQLFIADQFKIKTVERDENADVPNLVVFSDQENAEVLLDGQRAGTTGRAGLELWVTPGEMHNIAVIKEGYEPFKVAVWGKKSGLHRTDAQLITTETVAALDQSESLDNNTGGQSGGNSTNPVFTRKKTSSSSKWYSKRKNRRKNEPEAPGEGISVSPSPPSTPKTQETEPRDTGGEPPPQSQPPKDPTKKPEKPKKPKADPQNPWYSGEGNWSGAEVARKGCIRCHRSGINLRSKTTEEWVTFFRRKQHSRYGNLDQHFSPKEQVRVLRYLIKKLQGTP